MSKVSMHIGFTFRVGPLDQNQYGRIDLTVDQIDTELPVQDQLTEAETVSDEVYKFLKKKVDSQLDEMLGEE
jgi:hypothetical protein|tara:strand:+ start:246 stop:461 length:216 start_codon:yes stop_codon:yes gene_type:complete